MYVTTIYWILVKGRAEHYETEERKISVDLGCVRDFGTREDFWQLGRSRFLCPKLFCLLWREKPTSTILNRSAAKKFGAFGPNYARVLPLVLIKPYFFYFRGLRCPHCRKIVHSHELNVLHFPTQKPLFERVYPDSTRLRFNRNDSSEFEFMGARVAIYGNRIPPNTPRKFDYNKITINF